MNMLTNQELSYLTRKLKRKPNPVEVDIIGAEWSEHCSYKSSKRYIRLLPSSGPRVIIPAGHDAAALDIGNGYVLSIHIESHNHPSAIEPYGGAATGVGGVIRDIISLGTRPIALLDALRFGPITTAKNEKTNSKSKWLFKNVVSGIGDYGNCIGIPTIGGEIEFDPCFEDYCLVDVASIGIAKKDRIVPSKADRDDLIILAGGSTGRDGIHGASFASAVLQNEENSNNNNNNRSAVQIPDPFLEKLLLEATIEGVQHSCIKAMKDLGGGGLACCLSETADNLKKRFEVELDNVHTKHRDMSAAEIMMSESQERMLYITDSSKLEKLISIFDKYEIKYGVIGNVKDGSEVVIRFRGKVVASLPAKVFANAPLLNRAMRRPAYLDRLHKLGKKNKNKNKKKKNNDYFDRLKQTSDINELLLRMLSNPTIANKRWVYSQYDHEVGLRTVMKPGFGDASVLRVENGKFISVKLDGNSKHCYLDPYQGTLGCLSESCRNIICTGAEPIGIVDHLQFASPEDPEVFWTFVQTVNAIKDYCEYMKIPVVGGKVSFYNETGKGPIKPSPVIGSLGIIEQEEEECIPKPGFSDGESIFIIGFTYDEMGGSEYYEYCHNIIGGKVPKVNLACDKLNAGAILKLIRHNMVGCVHDCSKGGLGITVCEMAVAGEVGATIDLDCVPNRCVSLHNVLFSESQSRFIFGTAHPTEVIRILSKFKGLQFAKIGQACEQKQRVIFRSMQTDYSTSGPVGIIADIALEKLTKAAYVIEEIMNGQQKFC